MTASRPSERAAVITVQYGNGERTGLLASSFGKLERSRECRLVVVDNGGPDVASAGAGRHALKLLAQAATSPVSVVEAPRNLFYWRGAAFGLHAVYPDVSTYPDWLIICNNDVVFTEHRFLERLFARDTKEYPVIAPAIVSGETGRDQNPFLRRPLGALRRVQWAVYFLDYRVARTLLTARAMWERVRPRRPDAPPAEEQIFAPHGACVVLSREFFARGGRLDEGFDMYGEEASIAETSRQLGLPVYYCPDMRVLHSEHATVGPRLTPQKYALERQAYYHVRQAYR